MTTRSAASLVTAVMLGVMSLVWTPHPGGAQTAADPLRIEWQSRDAGGGQTVISGYVYNQHHLRVEHIRLRLEPSSGSSGARIVYLTGTIPSRGRDYFEVRVPGGEAPYQVTVASFDWFGCGSG